MTSTMSDAIIFDYIVVGGGTSGPVVARRLAEAKSNYAVCLIEAGPSHEGIDNSRMPGGLPALYQEGAVDWNYQTVPQKGCKNRVITASRGRLLGGCSAVNGTVFTRGAKADYNRIADMGNPGWSWNEMVPYFKASETFHPAEWHQADLSAHGADGPLHTEPHPLMPISQKVLDSFLDQGFEYKPDMFVQGEFEGVGHVVRTINQGIRTTGADFVHGFHGKNLTVVTGTHVDRIILETNDPTDRENCEYKAVGVEVREAESGRRAMIKAREEIILSAGAYNSPMILMHSGIGPKDHLTEMNIESKVHLPGVGSNLIDHPIVYTSYQINDPDITLDRLFYHNAAARASAIEEWRSSRTGPMARFVFGCFALKRIDESIQDPVWEAAKVEKQCSDPTGQLPDQPHVEYFNSELYLVPPDLQPAFPSNDDGVFTIITLLCAQQARGSIRLSSNDPRSKPIIDHAFLDNELDVAVLAEACRIAHEVVMKGRGTKDLIIGPWPKTTSFPTDLTAWKEHVRTFCGSCCHASGTCKMAPNDDPMGVVDHRLRVRNVKGLRVADVSILPILNSGHPQAPAYAIGEKVADMILQDAAAKTQI